MKALVLVAACSLLLAASPYSQPAVHAEAGTSSSTVSIDNFTFNAATVRVAVGTQVTWVNRDDVPHKVVSTEKKFSSPVLDTDGRFSYTFTTPGTYEYFCSLHPMMKGKVIVE